MDLQIAGSAQSRSRDAVLLLTLPSDEGPVVVLAVVKGCGYYYTAKKSLRALSQPTVSTF